MLINNDVIKHIFQGKKKNTKTEDIIYIHAREESVHMFTATRKNTGKSAAFINKPDYAVAVPAK